MEKRGRKKRAPAKPAVESFDAFFIRQVREGRLREWQRLEIRTFFNEKELGEKEDREVFEATLELY